MQQDLFIVSNSIAVYQTTLDQVIIQTKSLSFKHKAHIENLGGSFSLILKIHFK